jgi:hypothetical protein
MPTRASLLSAVFDENEISTLARSLNPNNVPNKGTLDEVHGLFTSQGLKFADRELEQVAAYYSSAVGQKEREILRTATARFAGGDDAQRKSLMQSSAPPRPKVEQLIRLYDIGGLFRNIGKQLPISSSQMEAILASIYGTLSDSELDEMITFHRSAVGQKCANAARTAGISVLSHSRA